MNIFKKFNEATALGKLFFAVLIFGAAYGGWYIWPKTSSSNTLAATDAAPGTDPTVTYLRISGSNTIGDALAPAMIKGFMETSGYKDITINDSSREEKTVTGFDNGKKIEVSISAHGTNVGFTSLTNAKSDICMASIPANNGLMEEHIIGLDGIAVIVNNNNKITEITPEDIRGIFSGSISDWSQVKSSVTTGPISIFRMDDNSGTFKTFKEMIGDITFNPSAKQLASSKDMANDVGTTKNSIGFVSYAFLDNNVRAVPIKSGNISIEPNALTIQSEKYPFCRRLYMYKLVSSENKLADALLKYTESTTGQAIVESFGFVNLSVNYDRPIVLPTDPQEYVSLINNAKKLTSELRFNSGSKDLDTRAVADIDRLISFLSQPDNRRKNVVLVGFSDNVGDPKKNAVLSKQRAESVQAILEQKGAAVKNSLGLGQMRPVRSNDNEEDRKKNRRVEIWIL